MNDPLRDPRFPNRPQTPDYWRLSEVCLRLDGASGEGGKSFEDVVGDAVDPRSLAYVAEQRVGIFLQRLGLEHQIPPALRSVMETIFVTSVVTGIEFQKAGGHRPS